MDTHEAKVLIAILIAVFFLAVILIYFFITLIQHHRKNVQLHQEKVNAGISALEAERKRMATDLHDDLGPFLSSIKLHINLLNTTDDEDLTVIKEISKHIDSIVDKVRETSNNLMPNVLIRKGLIVAINNFARNINNTKALTINTSFAADLQLDEEKEIHIYRIFQEGVHNTLKHANATAFEFKIEIKESHLFLLMIDNGKGFDSESITKESIGFGLSSISSRVDILKGDLYLDTAPGQGVKYSIVIPI